MRKITYTKMREQLADVLEDIRNGETLVVTQRGRPDTVLEGLVNTELSFHESEKNSHTVDFLEYPDFSIASCQDDNLKYIDNCSNPGIEFEEALNRTQIKHRDIIKALGDK